MKTLRLFPGLALTLTVLAALHAQVPQLINYQGRVAVQGTNYDGSGQFKFALVNNSGSTSFWSNDGTSTAGGEPGSAVSLTVSKGLYAVLLGDTTLANMTAIPTTVFTNGDVRLRVWFNDGSHGFQRLSPDQRIAPVGYAMMAATVPDGAVTSAKIAADAVGTAQLANGAVNSAQLAPGAVGTAQLASNSITAGQLAPGAAVANLNASGQSGVASSGMVLSTQPNAMSLLNAGYLSLGRATLDNDFWEPRADGPTNAASFYTAAVWTGTEMIIWGGGSQSTGARYNPTTDAWTTLTTNNAPPAVYVGHTAVWTGSEMIIWGGSVGSAAAQVWYNDGWRYHPATDTWTPTSGSGLDIRGGHVAVWTGHEMLIWGGGKGNDNPSPMVYFNDGARYDPTMNTWTPMSATGAPSPRSYSSFVWTGSELMVWGGLFGSPPYQYQNTGARYDPVTDLWTPMSAAGAPTARGQATAVWTGSEMIVWGGYDGVTSPNAGARYNPAADSWKPTATAGAPTGRNFFQAAWTGSDLIIWGGLGYPGNVHFGTASLYRPSTDTWMDSTSRDAPELSRYGTAVWTGNELLTHGGIFGSGPTAVFYRSLHRYTPPRVVYLYQKP